MNKIAFKLNPQDSFVVKDAIFNVDLTTKNEYHHT
jgi:hypothetical protein